jgi:AcrR family transcriptional regulator
MGLDTGTATPLPTRDRIVDTALRLFSERGTSAVSMRELAEAADVTVPGLYYHFASKADLIREMYHARYSSREGSARDGSARVGDANTERVPPTPGPVESMIVEQAGYEFDRLVADREFLRLMQRESVLGDPNALLVNATKAAEWRTRWVETLSLATDIDPSIKLAPAADGIVTFLWGLFVEYLNHQDEGMRSRIDDFAHLVARGLTSGNR